jgi:hypothetical protein
MTPALKKTAELVAKFKTGAPLTDPERKRLESYQRRTTIARSEKLLIRLLAEIDELFTPCRFNDMTSQQARQERIADYRRGGLRWYSNQRGTADRKSAERVLQELEEVGEIEVERRGNRAEFVRLTDATDQRLRGRCGLPGVAKALRAIEQMKELHKAGDYFAESWEAVEIEESWIAELFLIGWPDEPPDWKLERAKLWLALLPALARGWVLSNIDANGCVFYQITTKTLDAVAVHPLPKFDSAAFDVYGREAAKAQRVLASAKPSNENDLWLPLPVSWPRYADGPRAKRGATRKQTAEQSEEICT